MADAAMQRARRPLRDEEGSMTLEATLVFPWVLILSLALILLMLTVTDRALHYYTASIASERAAFAWPHSAANIRTGGYPPGAYDGLYWRLKDDALLAGLFGWNAHDGRGPIVRIGYRDERDSSLAASKLRKSAAAMPDGIKGTVAYRNQIWLKEVHVDASGSATPAVLLRLFPTSLSPAASASVSGVVSEPAEWLRTFQVARYYYERIKQHGSEGDSYREQAATVMEQRR